MPDTLLKEALLSGAASNIPEPAAETPTTTSDLLRGAGQICIELYGTDTPANRRRLYHEAPRWPLFRLEDDGVFYALRSRLRAFVEAKSAEREAQIAAAAAERETQIAAEREARLSRQSKRRRREVAGRKNSKQRIHGIA
jgi:hypothetical protein